MKQIIGLILFFLSSMVQGKLLLYSDGVFIGCLDCIATVRDSVCNADGRYGNPSDPKSIWNQNGLYGSPLSSKSPWSGSSSGPMMTDENGTVFGWFQINPQGGYTNSEKLNDLYQGMNGDLTKIRDAFCQD